MSDHRVEFYFLESRIRVSIASDFKTLKVNCFSKSHENGDNKEIACNLGLNHHKWWQLFDKLLKKLDKTREPRSMRLYRLLDTLEKNNVHSSASVTSK